MIYALLFWEFFQTGLFAIGGGLATLPFLYDMADRHPEWFTRPMLADMIAVSGSTPGAIGVNLATYAGFHAAGFAGSLCAAFGLVLPSLVIIYIIARFLQNFDQNPIMQSVFMGLRPAATGLLALAAWEVIQTSLLRAPLSFGTVPVIDYKSLILFALLFGASFTKRIGDLHPVFTIAFAALAGIVFKF